MYVRSDLDALDDPFVVAPQPHHGGCQFIGCTKAIHEDVDPQPSTDGTSMHKECWPAYDRVWRQVFTYEDKPERTAYELTH